MAKTAEKRLTALALCALAAVVFAPASRASWYWPFGSDGGNGGKARLSELMADATEAMDNAADLAADGKTSEAVAEYRKVLAELDKVEFENPDRAATSEFASVRTKRAIVNAAIDSLLMAQARENAKAVAVTDTTELERRFAEMRASRRGAVQGAASQGASAAPAPAPGGAAEQPKLESQMADFVAKERARARQVKRSAARAKTEATIAELLKADPSSRKARVMRAGLMMGDGDVAAAKETLREVLATAPDDVPALNMLAVCLATEGDYAEADGVLSQAMQANPRDYHAYYNMANLMLQATGDREVARRCYEAGRGVGGPEDKAMEESFR